MKPSAFAVQLFLTSLFRGALFRSIGSEALSIARHGPTQYAEVRSTGFAHASIGNVTHRSVTSNSSRKVGHLNTSNRKRHVQAKRDEVLGATNSSEPFHGERPLKNKVTLVLLELPGLGFLGVDRLYLAGSNIGLGFVKLFTFAAFGAWGVIDSLFIYINAITKQKSIDIAGMHGDFRQDTIDTAQVLGVVGLVLSISPLLCISYCWLQCFCSSSVAMDMFDESALDPKLMSRMMDGIMSKPRETLKLDDGAAASTLLGLHPQRPL